MPVKKDENGNIVEIPTKLEKPSAKIPVQVEEKPKEKIKINSQQKPTQVYKSKGLDDSEFVVGWLVIIDGAGKGNSINIGLGKNKVGRSEASRIRVDFGDDGISRDNHATITYAELNNNFKFIDGDSLNMNYVNGEDVTSQVVLKPYDKIIMGNTTFLFIPLCGDRFKWDK